MGRQKEAEGGAVMDWQEVRDDLTERFPQWADRIRLLRFEESEDASPTDNDGRVIYYNRRQMARQLRDQRCFYMARQLMHIQLAHSARMGERDRAMWKRSCDAVVDALLYREGFQLPEGVFLLKGADELCAEELYEVLLAQDGDENDESGAEAEVVETDPVEHGQQSGEDPGGKAITLDDPGLAAAVAGLAELLEPSLQMDFDWFPGSTIRDGMLRYDFRPYPVARAEILLDTSASVDAALLRFFVRGVKALLQEDAVVRVGCFDTQFYGFQDVHTQEDIDKLELHGSGGTDFNVAVRAFTGDAENQIIFTDGYAEMPEQNCDAVWVVYGSARIHPKGGRVIYVKTSEEKEKHEIDFLIT